MAGGGKQVDAQVSHLHVTGTSSVDRMLLQTSAAAYAGMQRT
jgi:hypothetical protein